MKRFERIGLVTLSLGLAVALGFAPAAVAATATSTFTVQATVGAGCTISAANMNFGVYDPAGVNAQTPLDTQGSLTVQCAQGIQATIGLNQGTSPAQGSTAAVPLRQMANPQAQGFLRYDLYQDAPGQSVWGDVGTNNVKPYIAPSSLPAIFTISGRIPAGQNVPIGNYLDTVVATISF